MNIWIITKNGKPLHNGYTEMYEAEVVLSRLREDDRNNRYEMYTIIVEVKSIDER